MKITFLIQTINGKLPFDFSFALVKQLDNDSAVSNSFEYLLYDMSPYQKYTEKKIFWFYERFDNYDKLVPVGSVEFVTKFLQDTYGIAYDYNNIPEELFQQKYLQRKCGYMNDMCGSVPPRDAFYKEIGICKGQVGFLDQLGGLKKLKNDTTYFWSERVDIVSEWRVFVHRNVILDARNYSGNPWKLPSEELIKEMVSTYSSSAPIAYTLDIAVLQNGETVLIEVHDFFSCGLYGFDSPKFPFMLSQWWFEYLRKSIKNEVNE